MSIPTTDQRTRGWNIEFLVGTSPIAGIYQHADLLSIGDVARDLDLCLVFDLPSRENCRPVLLPRSNARAAPIVLDDANTNHFQAQRAVSRSTSTSFTAKTVAQAQAPSISTAVCSPTCLRRATQLTDQVHAFTQLEHLPEDPINDTLASANSLLTAVYALRHHFEKREAGSARALSLRCQTLATRAACPRRAACPHRATERAKKVPTCRSALYQQMSPGPLLISSGLTSLAAQAGRVVPSVARERHGLTDYLA